MAPEILIAPSDYFSIRNPDEHYSREVTAATQAGYEIINVDF